MLYSDKTYGNMQKLSDFVRSGSPQKLNASRADGLKQYRRLFRNNINNTMVQAYPITFEILSKEQWDILIDDFFSKHDAKTPSVWKLPFEFYQFVENNNYSDEFEMPFLNDLMHFEWVEIEVYTMEDNEIEPWTEDGDIIKNPIRINPDYVITQLEYPVHQYAAKESVKHRGTYFLLTYRTQKSFDVKFIDLPVIQVYFVEKIANENLSAKEIIDELLKKNPQNKAEELEAYFKEFALTMFEQKVFIGYSRNYYN